MRGREEEKVLRREMERLNETHLGQKLVARNRMSSKGRSSIFTTFICVNLNFIVIAIDHLKDLTYRYSIHILEYSYSNDWGSTIRLV